MDGLNRLSSPPSDGIGHYELDNWLESQYFRGGWHLFGLHLFGLHLFGLPGM